MRCLYCDKRLSWFRSGSVPFCSEVHESSYKDVQAERLSNAQRKAAPAPLQVVWPPEAAPVAPAPPPIATPPEEDFADPPTIGLLPQIENSPVDFEYSKVLDVTAGPFELMPSVQMPGLNAEPAVAEELEDTEAEPPFVDAVEGLCGLLNQPRTPPCEIVAAVPPSYPADFALTRIPPRLDSLYQHSRAAVNGDVWISPPPLDIRRALELVEKIDAFKEEVLIPGAAPAVFRPAEMAGSIPVPGPFSYRLSAISRFDGATADDAIGFQLEPRVPAANGTRIVGFNPTPSFSGWTAVSIEQTTVSEPAMDLATAERIASIPARTSALLHSAVDARGLRRVPHDVKFVEASVGAEPVSTATVVPRFGRLADVSVGTAGFLDAALRTASTMFVIEGEALAAHVSPVQMPALIVTADRNARVIAPPRSLRSHYLSATARPLSAGPVQRAESVSKMRSVPAPASPALTLHTSSVAALSWTSHIERRAALDSALEFDPGVRYPEFARHENVMTTATGCRIGLTTKPPVPNRPPSSEASETPLRIPSIQNARTQAFGASYAGTIWGARMIAPERPIIELEQPPVATREPQFNLVPIQIKPAASCPIPVSTRDENCLHLPSTIERFRAGLHMRTPHPPDFTCASFSYKAKLEYLTARFLWISRSGETTGMAGPASKLTPPLRHPHLPQIASASQIKNLEAMHKK